MNVVSGVTSATTSAVLGSLLPESLLPRIAKAPTAIAISSRMIAAMPMRVARVSWRWMMMRWIADWVRAGGAPATGDGVTGEGAAGCCTGGCGAVGALYGWPVGAGAA